MDQNYLYLIESLKLYRYDLSDMNSKKYICKVVTEHFNSYAVDGSYIVINNDKSVSHVYHLEKLIYTIRKCRNSNVAIHNGVVAYQSRNDSKITCVDLITKVKTKSKYSKFEHEYINIFHKNE